MQEFDIIQRYFNVAHTSAEVLLGVGDDAAVLQLPPHERLVVSTDAFVQDVHFFANAPAESVGHKALAVNLSDMAAMGARPVACTLALGLPKQSSDFDEAWIAGFSRGLLTLAAEHSCVLIGGDTTRAPVVMATITILGAVSSDALVEAPALLRSGAQVGDTIWVTGATDAGLGDARLFLEAEQGAVALPDAVYAHAKQRMERPIPRVAMGQALRSVATAALDISDGALADLQHVLHASGAKLGQKIGAEIDASAVLRGAFVSDVTRAFLRTLPEPQQLHWQLNAGDDYELLFTAAPSQEAQVHAAAQQADVVARKLGVITASDGVVLRYDDGRRAQWSAEDGGAFAHF